VVSTDATGMHATVTLADGTPVTLDEGEFDFSWTISVASAGNFIDALAFERSLPGDYWANLPDGSGLVLIDIRLTDELIAEGLARDVIRAVQQARKEADLHISDRIELWLSSTNPEVEAAVNGHRSMIASEVLAVVIDTAAGPAGVHTSTGTVGEDLHLQVSLRKAM
jgi:hypothetical protein